MPYIAFAKETWKKTEGEKALVWRAYGIAWLVLSLIVFVPAIALMGYFQHYQYFQTTMSGSATFFVIFTAAILFIIGGLYSIFLFASIPYLCLRHLQGDPISVSVAVKKALLHKWKIFLNWLLFSIVYGILHTVVRKIFSGDCVLVCTYVFILVHIIWNISVLNILDKNETAWLAFLNSWRVSVHDIALFLFSGIWVLALSLFSLLTLFIGSIWAVPAQYNTFIMLYQSMNE